MEHLKHKTSGEDMIRTIILCLGSVMPLETNRLLLNQEIAQKTTLDRVAVSRYLELLCDLGIVNSYIFGNRVLYGLDEYFKNKMSRKGEEWLESALNNQEVQGPTLP